jgi:hypothetical protein
MKKIVLTAALAVASVAAFGQGYVNLGNSFAGSFIQPIFGPNPGSNSVEQTGSPAGIAGTLPSGGTTVYGGPLLQAGYDLTLYSGPSSATTLSQMTVVTTVPFRTATANKLPAGLITSSTVQIGTTGNLGGTSENFIVAAFSTEGGTVSTYAQALANYGAGDLNAQIGTSSLFNLSLGGVDSATGNTDLNPNTTGWTSFSLISVSPEPSTIALAGLGAAGLLLFRRKK